MDGWQILGGDAKRQLHVTTNLLRELDASANFKDGCHLRLGGFAWPIQYIKASEVLLISKCPNWNETSDEEDMFHKLEDVLFDQMLPIAIDIDI